MIYISIESRKGGVGKTTAALTLADCLIQKGYQVLLLDMDIIGTRIDNNFLLSMRETIHEVKIGGKPVNLLDLFKKEFMAGHNIPAFADEKEAGDKYLTFETGKCNIIGSNIYGDGADVSLVEDPRVLYDAFHAYWLMELVRSLTDHFVSAVGGDENIAVILDNSPGYSSIEKVVNDYLTDLGPDKGKILLVSTIDPQDLAACRQSSNAINNLLEEKIEAGRYYHALESGQTGTWKETAGFKAVWNNLCASGGRDPEYYAQKGYEKYSPFTRILVNKVPRNVYKQLYSTGILHEQSEAAAPFLNHMLYYFSNAMFERNGIHHQTNLGGKDGEFMLSCDMKLIIEDDKKYHSLRDYVVSLGLRNIFNEEWSPMAPFVKLHNYLRLQEVVKDNAVWEIPSKKIESKQHHNKIDYEVEVVKYFIYANLRENKHEFKVQLSQVASFVAQTIKSAEGMDEINFHPESQKLQDIEELTVLFGLAAYRLNVYAESCTLINELIKYCLEDTEAMEMLDAEVIDRRVSDVLEGNCKIKNHGDMLTEMLSNHRNARELELTIKDIIKYWNL